MQEVGESGDVDGFSIEIGSCLRSSQRSHQFEF